MNTNLSKLNDLLDEYEYEDAPPATSPEQTNPLAHGEVPPKEEDPALAYRRRKQYKYLKKYINNPYNDKVKLAPGAPRDYFWNVNPDRYYGK